MVKSARTVADGMTYVLEGLLAWVSAGGKILHRRLRRRARRDERDELKSVPIILLRYPFSADTLVSGNDVRATELAFENSKQNIQA